ncbi:MAG: sugar phosphate isomerase/epimerase [candidate division Zixibacteria bacterium]|nr:sugar phosphate isomerase/epimerase [candidate division Zixibacteria bacterium]
MAKKEYRFGISTTVDYSVEIETLFKLFMKYKFDFVSIGVNVKHNFYPDTNKFSEMTKMADDFGLAIESVHIPFRGDYDLANPIRLERLKAIDNVIRFLDYIAHNEIPIGILHPHHYLKDTKEKALPLAIDSINQILNKKPKSIQIAVENLPDNRGSWIADQLFNYFDKNEIDFCYDSSHENMSGGKFHLLRKHYSRLITCHLSDNNGTYDEHLVPGDGNIDWNQLASYMEKAESFRDILFEVGTGEKLAVPVEDYIKRTSQKAFEIFKDDNK